MQKTKSTLERFLLASAGATMLNSMTAAGFRLPRLVELPSYLTTRMTDRLCKRED
jgi:hypothetical protein